LSDTTQRQQARSIAQSYLKKVAEGEERWARKAENILNGKESHIWDILEERGYIKDVAGYVGSKGV
jgi:tyrosyl-tRNA synthetase